MRSSLRSAVRPQSKAIVREIGAVVWVLLLVIGVVGSMVSSIRRQRGASAAAPPRPNPARIPQSFASVQTVRVQPQAAPTRVPQAAPAPPPRPAAAARTVRPPAADLPARKPAAAGRFGNRSDLVRAVIAAEVLGKPRALRDE
jgi:soluble lytic murein transglycosylase-like protein